MRKQALINLLLRRSSKGEKRRMCPTAERRLPKRYPVANQSSVQSLESSLRRGF